MSRYRIGFDVGGTNIAAAVYDEHYNMIEKASVPFPRGKDVYFVCRVLKNLADELVFENGVKKYDVISVGIAVPGSIDSSGETVIDAHNLGFFDAPMLKASKEAFSEGNEITQNIALINDADAACLAEHKKGVLRGCNTAALITLGTGVGGGLIINGRLFKGGRGSGVEMGHMIIEQGGERCTCGNYGCAEALCSATWLINQGKKNFSGMIKTVAEGNIDAVTAKIVVDCAKAGDEVALSIFNKYVESLSSFIASLVNVLDIERVAIGGGVSGAGDFLVNPIIRKVGEKSFFRTHGDIAIAEFENDAGILGAALVHEY